MFDLRFDGLGCINFIYFPPPVHYLRCINCLLLILYRSCALLSYASYPFLPFTLFSFPFICGHIVINTSIHFPTLPMCFALRHAGGGCGGVQVISWICLTTTLGCMSGDARGTCQNFTALACQKPCETWREMGEMPSSHKKCV